jgi:hypothetical protein
MQVSVFLMICNEVLTWLLCWWSKERHAWCTLTEVSRCFSVTVHFYLLSDAVAQNCRCICDNLVGVSVVLRHVRTAEVLRETARHKRAGAERWERHGTWHNVWRLSMDISHWVGLNASAETEYISNLMMEAETVSETLASNLHVWQSENTSLYRSVRKLQILLSERNPR